MGIAGGFYNTKRWERVSNRILSRYPICVGCEERPSRNVDHIVPLDRGGAPYDPNNLQSLCVACHVAKTTCDKARMHWIMPKHRGCDANGMPRKLVEPRHASPHHPLAETGKTKEGGAH